MDLGVGADLGDTGEPVIVCPTMMSPVGCVARKEFNSVRYTYGFCSWNVALIVMVMMIGWSNIESLGSVVSPGWAFSCAVVNNNLASSWS